MTDPWLKRKKAEELSFLIETIELLKEQIKNQNTIIETLNSQIKPKFSLDRPPPKIQNDLPQEHQDMWKNIIDRYKSRPNEERNYSDNLMDLMIERRKYGIELYGTPLQVSNGRNAIADLISELLGAVVYAEIVRLEYQKEPNGWLGPGNIVYEQEQLLNLIDRLLNFKSQF